MAREVNRGTAPRGGDAARHIPGDAYWHFIVGHTPPGLPESEAQNRVVIAALAFASAAYDRGGFDVFVDALVRPTYLDVVLEIYGSLPLDHVVLKLETAIERARSRGDSDPTVLMTAEQLAAPDLIEEQIRQRYALFADLPNTLERTG